MTALDELAYCLFEELYAPWSVALKNLDLNTLPDFEVRVQDTQSHELGYQLQVLSADILVAIGSTQINTRTLPQNLLALNIHPGVLPRYKGVGSPEAMVLGKPAHVGFTVHRLRERLDEGEIFLRKWCSSPLDFNASWVYVSNYKLALDALAMRIDDIYSEKWPVEDDFAGINIPAGGPLWRMTLTRVWLWNFMKIVRFLSRSKN